MKPKALTTRRRFFWKAGAAFAAPLAVASGEARGGTREDTEALEARLALLEDLSAIRELNLAYARHVNAHAYEKTGELFDDPADALLVEESICSLSADPFGKQDVIEISADRASATARIECTAVVEAPIEPMCPLVEMARQQGGGVTKRSESAVLENEYVKRGGVWRIRRSAYIPSETQRAETQRGV